MNKVLLLGICPALGVTTTGMKGFGIGLATTIVLVIANLIFSLTRKLIPERIKLPVYIILTAFLVTMEQFVLQAYFPEFYHSLGIYMPLIALNGLIVGCGDRDLSQNPVLSSVFDGLRKGLGLTLVLTILGILREVLAVRFIFGDSMVTACGAFFVLAFLMALWNHTSTKRVERNMEKEEG